MDHALHHVREPSREYDLALTVTEGAWPAGIAGHAFIIGPSQPGIMDFVWAGTGILTRVDLAPDDSGAPHWISKNLVTPEAMLLGGLFTGVEPADLGGLLAGAGIPLTNTSPHTFGDRLILTFDQQRPVEFDPVTLEFKAYLGARDEYPEVKPHALFPEITTTGHPVEDVADACLWWCNLLMSPLGKSTTTMDAPLHVVRWDGKGGIQTWSVPGARITQGIHEVTVSRDYVIFTEVGFQHEPGAIGGRGRTKVHPPYTDIYLVAKRDLTADRVGQAVPVVHARVPYESFHEFADYDQDGDDVTLYIAHSTGWDINYAITPEDRVWGTGAKPAPGLTGFFGAPVDAAPIGRYVINGRTGEVKDTKLFLDPYRHWGASLYSRDMRPPALGRAKYLWQSYMGCDPEMLIEKVVEMYADHPFKNVPVAELPTKEVRSSLACLDLATMTEVSAWSAPEGTFCQSPVYVPDEAGGGDGWVLLFIQHRDKTELALFDALDLTKGPICVATSPGLKQSYQVHSGYMPRIRSEDQPYPSSFAADLGDAWRQLPAAARRAVEPVLEAFA
jgi:carotenoid cleavage dioxygenase-like enzyme